MIRAVVFDLDGVLIESEQVWDRVRRDLAARAGGRWADEATTAMHGMSSPEWSAYMHDRLGVPLEPARIVDAVVEGLLAEYRRSVPLLPGAVGSVRRLAGRWPLAVASSSNRPLIDEVLRVAGISDLFRVTVSSEEVARGKPAPDVYLEALDRLRCPPAHAVAIEDSANGIRSAAAAGLAVVAVPNREYPPPAEVLGLAAAVVADLGAVTVGLVETLDPVERRLDEEEEESFPASDPHSDWAG